MLASSRLLIDRTFRIGLMANLFLLGHRRYCELNNNDYYFTATLNRVHSPLPAWFHNLVIYDRPAPRRNGISFNQGAGDTVSYLIHAIAVFEV